MVPTFILIYQYTWILKDYLIEVKQRKSQAIVPFC